MHIFASSEICLIHKYKEKLYFEVIHAYDCFDIEENVLLMLEAKRILSFTFLQL